MTLEKRLKGLEELEKENKMLMEKVSRMEKGFLTSKKALDNKIIEKDVYLEMFCEASVELEKVKKENETLKELNRMENLSNCPDHELLGMHTRIESEMYRRKLVKNTNSDGRKENKMKKFLIGVNGEHTPDPEYWRSRNEIIEGDSTAEIKIEWLKLHECWYAGEPLTIIDITEQFTPEQGGIFGSNWKFTENGGATRI